jgi:hypothetical protein
MVVIASVLLASGQAAKECCRTLYQSTASTVPKSAISLSTTHARAACAKHASVQRNQRHQISL